MKDEDNTREQLINELVEMRRRNAELDASEPERKRAEEASSHPSRYLAVIPVLAFIAIIITLVILDISVVFEPSPLLFILNTLFISVIVFAVAYISARSYLTSGLPSLFLLGGGVLAFGAGNLVAGWLIGSPGGPNVNVTIHNTGALFGSAFHLVSATLILAGVTSERALKRGKLNVTLAYLGVLVLTALVTIASLQGAIPPFFIQGVGPTLLRQVVLGTAVALFALSSLLFMRRYSRSKSGLLYWYSLALALIAVGLSAVLLQKAVGSPIGWVGRSAQYLGGIYFLTAVLTTMRGARAKGIPLERIIATFFREAEELYRALVETVTDAIISIDHEGRVLLWNSASEKMFGYGRGEAVGSLLVDLIVSDQDADGLRADLENLAQTGESHLVGKATELEAKRKGGEIFPVELSISARKTADGWISTIIIRDITERKELEKMKAEFVSMVSHELRTPLTSIKGYADLLLAGDAGELNQPQEEFLGVIVRNSDRLTELINDLLDIEGIESGERRFEFRELKLDEILRDVAKTFAVNAKEKGLSLESEIEDGIMAKGDVELLSQAFANLLSNAIKYTKEGSICLRAKNEGGKAIVQIRDTGIGMTKEELARLFTRFFRSDNPYVKEAGGTGLGLSIVKATIDRHGGAITVESEPNRGSTFTVSLPRC